ncbi:MAG TPA: hypothetical protein VMP01_06855 [Pirellulaceae bacterium]|nr:hypothetical protein [Pirellulaceae bacterium]
MFDRDDLFRKLDLQLYDVGLLVQSGLRLAAYGRRGKAALNLSRRTGYSQRRLYDLAKLVTVFTGREYKRWLDTIPAGHLILIATLSSPRDRQELLRRLPGRPLCYRLLLAEVGRRQRAYRRRKGRAE